MEDITDLMLRFKDAVRHTWNSYFADNSPMSPWIQDAFDQIEHGLFQGIVLAPLDISGRAIDYRTQPLEFIQIRPPEILSELTLQVGNRDSNGNMVWTSPIAILKPNITAFFIEFFDWYSYSHIDLPYVKVHIASLPSMPRLEGKVALIEQRHCRFFFAGDVRDGGRT